MKCAACGYEKRNDVFHTVKPVYVKIGKRKGELKDLIKERIEPFRNDPSFLPIIFREGNNEVKVYEEEPFDCGESEFSQRSLYACPQCGTLKIQLYFN